MKTKNLALLGITILLASCGEMPFYRSGAALGRLTFATGSAGSRSPAGRGSLEVVSPRMLTDPSMSFVDAFYTGYGTLVGTFTPENVVLPISLGEILLFDEGNPFGNIFIRIPPKDALDDPAQFIADFASPVAAEFVALPRGQYDRLELRLNPGHSLHVGRGYSHQPDYTTWTECSVQVELPGYGLDLIDIPSRLPDAMVGNHDFYYDFSSGWEEGEFDYSALQEQIFNPEAGRYFERKRITGDDFIFTMQYLYPRRIPSVLDYRDVDDAYFAQWHVFTSEVNAARYARSGEGDYSRGTLLIPLSPIEIGALEKETTIVLHFDVENLIEVYDNNTPGDKTDDIVVLAKNYWERFSISLE